MVERCRVQMLGELSVRIGERTISRFRTQKTASLLAYLSFHLDHTHPREVLADLLWPWSPAAASRTTLRVALSSLRRQLEPPGVPQGAIIIADRNSIGLNPDNVSTDVGEFEATLAELQRARGDTQRLRLLTEAVDLYGGLLLPGHYEEWLLPEQMRLGNLYFHAVSALTAALREAGEHTRAIDYAARAVAAEPMREEAHRALISLLLEVGRTEEALKQYRRLERILLEETGGTPAPATRALIETAAGAATVQDPVTPMPPPDAHLPTGTVSLLFAFAGTGEEGPDDAPPVLPDNSTRSLRKCFERHDGHVARALEDGLVAAFEHASNAVACAVECQQQGAERGSGALRTVVYTDEVELSGGDYSGPALHRASRLLAAGHPRQLLISETTAALMRGRLADAQHVLDLGTFRLGRDGPPERIFQVVAPGMHQGPFPPLRAQAGMAGRMPLTVTRFVGRGGELERLREALTEGAARLVTLLGSGGCGKTRLAIEAGRALAADFGGAVWFASLQDVDDGAAIGSVIADAMGLPRSGQADPLAQAVAALSRQPSLLVLDNLEHLVEDGARIVSELLAGAPTLTILVTSRRSLGLQGESMVQVPPLPVPAGEQTPAELAMCPSVELFVDRAQAVRPDFQITEGNASSLAELCRGLEGIPLALELAAGRVQALSPAAMVQQLGDRLDVIVARARDVPDRHRTLRATIGWSYRLLPAELQALFAQLSVFRGGWTLDGAEAVCRGEGVLEAVLDLCNHSLVFTDEDETTVRFRMLETIRQFAEELLDDEHRVELHRRHAAHFLAFAEVRAAEADGPGEAAAFSELEAELANLRAAFDRSGADAEHELTARLAAAMADFLWRRGRWRDHEKIIGAGLAAAGRLTEPEPELTAQLAHALARVAWDRGELEQAQELVTAGLTGLSGTGKWSGALRNLEGLVLLAQGDPEPARAAVEDALAISRNADDSRQEGMALHNLGVVAFSAGDFDSAQSWFEKALPVREAAGDIRGSGETRNNLAFLAENAGDIEEADRDYRQALQLFVRLEDVLLTAIALCNIGEIALRLERPEEAAELLGPAAHTLEHLGSVHCDHALSCLAEATGQPRRQTHTSGLLPWREELMAAARRAVGD